MRDNSSFDTLYGLNQLSVKQQQVLIATIFLFSQKGYAGTSTQEISKVADVSIGTVFKRFKTKEKLLAAVLDPFVEKIIPKSTDEILLLLTNGTYSKLENLLNYIVDNRLSFAFKYRQQLRILLSELIYDSKLFQSLEVRFKSSIQPILKLSLDKFQKNGQLTRDLTLNQILVCITNTIVSKVIYISIMPAEKIVISELITDTTELLLHNLQNTSNFTCGIVL